MSNSLIKPPTQTKESLFHIGEHFYVLESLIIDSDGEIDEIIDQWLDEYHAKEEDKIDAYCYLVQKYLEISEEAKRLAERSSSYSKKAQAMKNRLKSYLERRGRDKIETTKFTIKVCQNGGKQPIHIYEGVNVEMMPEHFVRTFKEPDMEEIRKVLLEDDKQLASIACLLPRGTHLRIK